MSGRARTTQELIHWLEMGQGARWVVRGALVAAALLVSGLVAWRQFHGAATESTLAQADLARQVASGAGFTTGVNYPQAVAYLKERGVRFDPAAPYPEVYQAPFYAVVLAVPLAAVRIAWRRGFDSLFDHAAAPPLGYGGDYFLLAVNVLLFWAALWLAFSLARRMFGAPSAWVSAVALFVSVSVWQQVAAVNGTALMMVLALGVFHAWWRCESAESSLAATRWLLLLGGLCGCLFLTEYSSGVLVLVALAGVGRRFASDRRGRALALVAAGFALVSVPWVARNLAVTGLPLGLATQNVALKAGDTTAEPATVRATLSAKLPEVDLNKVANKALTSVQDCLRNRIWSGGAMWLTAFFAAGWLYEFRSAPVNRMRWLLALSILVLIASQATFSSGDSERQVCVWMAPLIIVFGSGFFFVLLGSHPLLSSWPRACAAALLALQSLPLIHDAAEPRWLHFQYPPYIPQLLQGVGRLGAAATGAGHFGVMADVPAGLAWYGRTRAWAQPATLHDFYAVQVEQPTGALLLTPKTLDRPFFSDLNATSHTPTVLNPNAPRIGEWGEVYGGLLTGTLPREFPLTGAGGKVADNLYILVNPALPGVRRR